MKDGDLSGTHESLDPRGTAGKIAKATGFPRGKVARPPHIGGTKSPRYSENTGAEEVPMGMKDKVLGIETQ